MVFYVCQEARNDYFTDPPLSFEPTPTPVVATAAAGRGQKTLRSVRSGFLILGEKLRLTGWTAGMERHGSCGDLSPQFHRTTPAAGPNSKYAAPAAHALWFLRRIAGRSNASDAGS